MRRPALKMAAAMMPSAEMMAMTTAMMTAAVAAAVAATVTATTATTAVAATVAATTAAATVTTTTSATSAAAAAAAATVATTTSATALFPRAGFIDGQRPSIDIFSVHSFNRRLGARPVGHFDESKSFASPGVTVHDHLCAFDLPIGSKQLLELLVADAVAQIADVKTRTH